MNKQKKWIANDVSSVEVINEPLYAGLRITRKYMNSVIKQDIILKKNAVRLDFVTEIDWHEDHVLLRAAFPFDVRAEEATYEIQFGHMDRPITRNNNFEAAKFEVCNHKWSDLSESRFGVAILNDSKYGFSVEENTVTVSCLRAPKFPNKNADIGKHNFTVSLLPHKESLAESDVIREAYSLNYPLEYSEITEHSGDLPEVFSLVGTDDPNVIIECIKRAEASDDAIVRLYEIHGGKTVAHIKVHCIFKRAYLTDLMENEICDIPIVNGVITLPLKNFEIATLKLVYR